MSNNSWTIDESLTIDASENERLHTRTPEISNPGDFQQILVSLALRHPFSNLWIERGENEWIVRGTKGVALSKVDFEMAPLSLVSYLRATATPYLGQVHSDELRQKLEHELKSVLNKHGYMAASI